MKRLLLVMVLGLAAFGCSNDCDDAVEHMEECGGETLGDVDTDECDGQSECVAGCINDASCEELQHGSDKLTSCMGGCL
jgi:hypothetical protein